MDAPPKLVDFAISRWREDPFSQGAWSTLNRAGTATSRKDLGAPVSHRLILAGEATHPTAPAMVHGAWLAGRAAAEWAAALGHRRVAIVGAGFAGIGAALRLAELGLQPVVIEARLRLGGRVWSRALGDVVVESGANWLQQAPTNPLRQLAKTLGYASHNTDFHAPLYLGPAAAVRAASTPGLIEALIHSATSASPDMPLTDWRQAWAQSSGAPDPAAIERIIAAEFTLESGLSLEELTVRSISEAGVGEGDEWLPQGLSILLQALAQGLDIRLGQVVTTLRDRTESVALSGLWGELEVECAIVTAPVAVLQSGAITFDPPLPAAHQAALQAMTAARIEKISLRFDRRFWPRSANGYLRVMGAEPWQVSEWLDMTDTVGAPVLTGLFADKWADDLWQGTDAEIAARIADVLRDHARP
jgi:monoamine oxidase